MIRGVIFDMDGLLFDSEAPGIEVMLEAAALQNAPVTREDVLSGMGMAYPEGKANYEARVPGIDAARLYRDFSLIMRARAAKGEILLKKGARALLDHLHALGIPCALASSSGMDAVMLYLNSQGIADRFRVILGGPKGVPSKPRPDIFLLAAENLGLAPADCLVLEDSYNGIRAGRAAGMTVCMVPDQIPYREAFSCYVDLVLPDLDAVRETYFSDQEN